MYLSYKLPFQYFLGLGCHLGSRFHLWSVETSPNVLFKTSDYPIINLTSTSLNFIVSIKFIKFCASRNLKPLFFFSQGTEPYLEKTDSIWRFAYYIVQYWLPGIISNFKFVYKKDKYRSIPGSFLLVRRYPDFLIFLGTTVRTQHLAATESRTARMPGIGLSDTDSGPAMFNYSIFSNSKSFVTAFNFYKLFARAVIDGANFFTITIGDKLFSFYKNFLRVPRLSGLRGTNYPFSSVDLKLRNRAPVYGHVWKLYRLFSTYMPVNVFLAQFSYSVLFFSSRKPGFFRKLVYSRSSGTMSIAEFPRSYFNVFRRFKNLLKSSVLLSLPKRPCYDFLSRYKPLSRFIHGRRKLFKKLMVNRRAKRRKNRIAKYSKSGHYTKRFLLSRIRKKLVFYNGFNVLRSLYTYYYL